MPRRIGPRANAGSCAEPVGRDRAPGGDRLDDHQALVVPAVQDGVGQRSFHIDREVQPAHHGAVLIAEAGSGVSQVDDRRIGQDGWSQDFDYRLFKPL